MKFLFYSLLCFLLSGCGYKITQHQETYTLSKKGTNFYLIKENNSYLMIDTGTPNNGEKIEKILRKNNILPEQIAYIILTHGHYDHAGNAAYFKNKFGTKIIAGKGDTNMIKHLGKDSNLCATSIVASFGTAFIKKINYLGFQPDIWIDNDYDLFNIGFTGSIVPLAGHTQGSLIVSTPQNIFVGDLIRGSLLNSKKAKRHFYMCDLQDNNHDIDSIYKMASDKKWYLGHGGPLESDEILKFIHKNVTPKTTH